MVAAPIPHCGAKRATAGPSQPRPFSRSDAGRPPEPRVCHHTREPTVLSRVSCRPFRLNFDRFHQPCLLPGRTSRIGGFPVPRGDHLPLRAAQFSLLVRLTGGIATPTGRHHGRILIHPSLDACATPSDKGVCKHAGSGPLRVRRRLLRTCLGDPISLAILIVSETAIVSF